jgi:hypothetical protein
MRVTQSVLEATSKGKDVPQARVSSWPTPHTLVRTKTKVLKGLKIFLFRAHIYGVSLCLHRGSQENC